MTVEAVGAENYGTISYVVESPHEKGVLWTGSDDGLVHLTRDGGKTWKNVTPIDLDECLVNAIEVSPHDKATAYLATTRYKFNDKRPGLYKTTDYGKSWTMISDGIPDGSFTRVVREDAGRKDLLFAGTETGMFISWNGGIKWAPFQLNLPVTPILDLIIRHDDIIVATSGRSFWILDDLGLIRQYKPLSEKVALYQPEAAFLSNHGSELNQTKPDFSGMHPSRGVNPANGIVIYYQLPKLDEKKHIELEILNSNGKRVHLFTSKKDETFEKYAGGPSPPTTIPKNEGLNRFVWDMRYSGMPGIPTAYIEGSYRGHKAIPGEYRFILKVDGKKFEQTCSIKPNPLYPTTAKEYTEYHGAMSEMERTLTEIHNMTNRLYQMQTQLRNLLKSLPDEKNYKSLKKEGEKLAESLKKWDEEMVQRKSKAYDDVENFPNKFTAEYLFLINQTESPLPRVTQASKNRRKELEQKWNGLKKQGDEFINQSIPAYNRKLWDQKIGAIYAKPGS